MPHHQDQPEDKITPSRMVWWLLGIVVLLCGALAGGFSGRLDKAESKQAVYDEKLGTIERRMGEIDGKLDTLLDLLKKK